MFEKLIISLGFWALDKIFTYIQKRQGTKEATRLLVKIIQDKKEN